MRKFGPAIVLLGLSCSDGSPQPSVGEPNDSTPLGVTEPGPALRVIVRSGDDLMPMPSRLLIRAVGATRKPDFRTDGFTTIELAPGALGDPEGVLLVSGQARLPLPPGTYQVRAVQGPEYEVVERTLEITKQQSTIFDVTLEHSVRTDGWLAADMHIHSAPRSFDSRLGETHRVVSEVSSGIELLVPTDHVNHNDLQPAVQALGYTRRAVSIAGSEYGFRDGHIGVFPVEVDPKGKLYGAPAWEEWPWNNIDAETYFPLIHALPGQPVVVVNHPRLAPDLGYFRNIRWTPGQPLAAASLFDGLEVLAGYEQQPEQVTALLRDWFYLLSTGARITALGNSDTHRLDWLRAGYPRSWLRLPTEEPDRVLPEDLRAAIAGMRAIASNGPFVSLTVDGKEIGDTAVPREGRVRAEVTADAPGWIDLTRVQVYRNGELVREIPVTSRSHPALRQSFEVDVPADGWIVAVAIGDRALPTEIVGAIHGGKARPIALTNPVWIDADADRQVSPPKAPPPRPSPWDLGDDRGGDSARADAHAEPTVLEELLHVPLAAPLDCEPADWAGWLADPERRGLR